MNGPVILLDIDGVLSPLSVHRQDTGDTHSVVHEPQASLVREIATLGEIVWASTWDSEMRRSLATRLGLDVHMSVSFSAGKDTEGAMTPKLSAVRQWMRMRKMMDEFEWDCLIWIDDSLRDDATHWLASLEVPTLAVTPDSGAGLTRTHVDKIREFCGGLIGVPDGIRDADGQFTAAHE